MASIVKLLAGEKKELMLGEITGRSGNKYVVDLKDRIVNIESSISTILTNGTQVFVTNIDNQLRIIATAAEKSRDEKETVIVNG